MKLYFFLIFLILLLSLRFISFFQNQKTYQDRQELTFTKRLIQEPQ